MFGILSLDSMHGECLTVRWSRPGYREFLLSLRRLWGVSVHVIIINMRLGRVAKRLIERPKTALHPVAFFDKRGG